MKNYSTFKHPYVLIEDSKNKYQPFYKEYTKEIPHINYESPALCCPFSSARRSTKPRKRAVVKSGYCEVCFIKFDNYDEHIETKEHREYANDEAHYQKIDQFIDSIKSSFDYNIYRIPESPCDKLEAGLSKTMDLSTYGNDCNSSSLIRFSRDSSCIENEVIPFDTILYNIEKKLPKDK